jgi:predicted O-methyltransferase YrrM
MLKRGYEPILVDYLPKELPRYGYGKPPHSLLLQAIERNREQYRETLTHFVGFLDKFSAIPLWSREAIAADPTIPYWETGSSSAWFPGIDAISLYSMLALNHPAQYLEIGSGLSTLIARRSVSDNNLHTVITSIDPHPRREIDAACDNVIRLPLEDIDLSIFDQLNAGDILFVDGSHRVFMNSDATILFLEVIPRLNNGVFIHIHDIFLPYDYPPKYANERRYYSEQYLLAVAILSGEKDFDIVLPNYFVSQDSELNGILDPIFSHEH